MVETPPSAPRPAPLPLGDASLRSRLRRFEADLAGLIPSGGEVQTDHFLEPLARASQELAELAAQSAQAEPQEPPALAEDLLADAADWQWRCTTAGAISAADRAARLQRRLLASRAQAWQAHVVGREATLDERFRQLQKTEGMLLAGLEMEPPPPEAAEALRQTRSTLWSELSARLPRETVPPSQIQNWAIDLIDQSDTVLAGLDECPPQDAAELLTSAIDSLGWALAQPAFRAAHRRSLARAQRRLCHERRERLLQTRLEDAFGRTFVARWERWILFLIVAVVGLLAFEWFADVDDGPWRFWLDVADSTFCAVFLVDFFTRLWLTPERGRWFARHWLFELLPAIPYGLLTGAAVADAARAGRLARLLRLPQLVRYVRLLRPFIRLLRAGMFLMRGLDQLGRRLAPLLNHNVILYPNRAERRLSAAREENVTLWSRRLRRELRKRFGRMLHLAPDAAERERIAALRLDVLEKLERELPQESPAARPASGGATRELPAEVLIRRLAQVAPEEIELNLGPALTAQSARVLRTFAARPLCWFPVVHGLVPPLDPRTSDAEQLATAARHVAARLKRAHDRWFFVADLHGTVTPSQFIDRCGTMLIRSSFRPAYRLALFGGFFMLVDLALKWFAVSGLAPLRTFLVEFVRPTVMLLGGVCLAVFGFGWWLRRIAREATEFYERAAQAQFLALTEIIRSRHIDRDARLLYRRALAPEWRLREPGPADDAGRVRAVARRIELALLGSDERAADGYVFEWLDRVVLLHRDSLDGAMYADNDNRTTSQLLGNPAIRQLLSLSARFGQRELRNLHALDLERQKSLLGGPYLWFTLTSRAVAHSVAALLIDYNRHAVPLAELPLCGERERARYERWLAAAPDTGSAPGGDAPDASGYVTTAFTALHFLDFDAQRDVEIAQRFGPAVLERLGRDRCRMIRRIFGAYPSHRLPKEQRVLNLHSLFLRWLAHGRVLLTPLYALLAGARSAWRLLRAIALAIREVRRPELRVETETESDADFSTAIRKIDRIRGPVVYASLRLRSRCDPEFLGATLATGGLVDLSSQLEDDLRFLDPDPWATLDVRGQQRRAKADMRRLDQLIAGGLLERVAQRIGLPPHALSTAEHRRALAVAYLADFREVRTLLSCREILAEVFDGAALQGLPPKRPRPRPLLARLFRRYWRAHGTAEPKARAAAWQATLHNYWGAADALRAWRDRGERTRDAGEERLGELLRHPGRISEQIVTLRTIQTLSILDQLNYRSHVYELGRYADLGDIVGDRLDWGHSTDGERPLP